MRQRRRHRDLPHRRRRQRGARARAWGRRGGGVPAPPAVGSGRWRRARESNRPAAHPGRPSEELTPKSNRAPHAPLQVGAANAGPPPGAVPTITVHSLQELNDILLRTRRAPGDANGVTGDAAGDDTDDELEPLLGWRARVGGAEGAAAVAAALADPLAPGAPAPGLDFADYLIHMNAMCIASTSFPRMGAAAGGLQACPVGGHSVLHLQCGSGALTKMLASKGLRVCGADGDVAAAAKRGLRCFAYGAGGGGAGGAPLAAGALAAAREAGPYDVALFYQPADGSGMGMAQLLARSTLDEVKRRTCWGKGDRQAGARLRAARVVGAWGRVGVGRDGACSAMAGRSRARGARHNLTRSALHPRPPRFARRSCRAAACAPRRRAATPRRRGRRSRRPAGGWTPSTRGPRGGCGWSRRPPERLLRAACPPAYPARGVGLLCMLRVIPLV